MDTIKEGHVYAVRNFERCPNPDGHQQIVFLEMDADGIYHDGTTNEEVLLMMINRMEYLQTKFPCSENEAVIKGLNECLSTLLERTAKRIAQGVEGKHLPHKE